MTDGRVRIAAALAIAIAASVYVLRLDDVAGLIVDDAFYIVLAKAIAGGDGFRLISSAATPIMPAGVPPGFPALLAPVFLFAPSYPANLMLLKLISLLAMAGAGVACWYDLTRHRDVADAEAILIATAVVLTPSFVFLATSTVMAECAFTLAQLAVVIAVERIERSQRRPPIAIAAGVIAAAAMLIRTAGVAVIVAAVVYLAYRRRWQALAIFAVTAIACVLPWQLYARASLAPFEERHAHGGSIAYTYPELLARTRPGAVNTTVTFEEFGRRAGRNVGGVIVRDVGATVVPELFRGPSESGEEVVSIGEAGRGSMGTATATKVISALLFLVALAGVARTRAWMTLPALVIAASMAMIAAVPVETFRYVVPLAPFVLMFVWRGLANQRAARLVILLLLGLHLRDHALYLMARANGNATWIEYARQVDEVLAWLNGPEAQAGPVAATNAGLVYLRTGRKAIGSAMAFQNWTAWETRGIRYVVALRSTDRPRRGVLRLQTRGRLWILEM
jgi:hypothetical protein